MVKIKLLIARAEARGSQNVGDVVTVSAAEAERLIETGCAVPVREGRAAEKAVPKRRPEKAAK